MPEAKNIYPLWCPRPGYSGTIPDRCACGFSLCDGIGCQQASRYFLVFDFNIRLCVSFRTSGGDRHHKLLRGFVIAVSGLKSKPQRTRISKERAISLSRKLNVVTVFISAIICFAMFYDLFITIKN